LSSCLLLVVTVLGTSALSQLFGERDGSGHSVNSNMRAKKNKLLFYMYFLVFFIRSSMSFRSRYSVFALRWCVRGRFWGVVREALQGKAA